MNATRETPGTRRCGLAGSGGYSLIEMTVAVAMAAIIGMGIYAFFNAQQRSSRAQKTYNDLQTACSFAMDTIKNDLLLAGYNARNTAQPIKAAAANSIAFEFFDQKASADTSVYDPLAYSADTKITLALTGTTLTKTIERWHNGDAVYKTPQSVTLARNIQNLDFTYLKGNNEAWSVADGLGEIRAIRVGLRCRADATGSAIFNAPELGSTAPKFQEIALTTEVRPRNVNIARSPDDLTPPAVPASKSGQFIKVWDEGTCGCLDLNWSSNTDSDIAGYMIFYGPSTGNYIGRARAEHLAGATQTYKLGDLPLTNVPYFIALSAFDNSGNQSGLSVEVTGNPAPSIRTLAGTSAGNDTTITPLPPAAPSGLTVATPADQQLTIGWTKTYADCMTSKTFGYRLYRSTNPSFAPDGTIKGVGNCIADETVLRPDTVSYQDLGTDTALGHLGGCVPYYYKLAVVNCDPAQISHYTNPPGSTNYTAAQFASISGTPTDGTPTNAPLITSKSGFRRIILSVTNPSRATHPDFISTKIYFSTTAFPQMSATRDAEGFYIVNGGTPIPDGGGEIANGGGPWAINFDDEDSEIPNGSPAGIGNPQLDPTKQYYFLAVAYDRCKNAATNQLQSQTAAVQCADGLVGEPWRDAPPAPENLRITKGCDGRPLTLEWDYSASNYTDYPDFQGFRVVRCTGTGCVPVNDPSGGSGTIIGSTTYLFPDTSVQDDTVDDGLVYNYRVFAGDCYYQRWLEGLLTPAEKADNPPDNNASYSNLSDLSLGYLGRAQVTDDARTTLSAAISAVDTTIPVVSTTGFTRRTFQIGSEVVECTGASANSFTGCTRGSEATVAIAHFAGDIVISYPPTPPRAAISGDLTLNPATFLHNTVKVGAKNTSAGTLLFRKLEPISWQNAIAWLKSLFFNSPAQTLYDGATLPTPSNVTLGAVQVDALVTDVPTTFRFLRQDGSLDNLVDLRNDEMALTWKYRNNSTLLECSREWIPPDPSGIVVPEGPVLYGTAQSKPFAGTLAWPVPGSTGNPKDAVVVPAGSRVRVSTYVQNNAGFGTSIASARLYYYVADPASTAAPAVGSAYPACSPYTMLEMTNVGGTSLWYADIPPAPASPSDHDNKSVWYFVVGVDSEGNFDREPEAGNGAFQYYQRAADPCLNTPAAPVLSGTPGASSMGLDWSASWTTPPSPATYKNTDGSDIADLAGFKIYRQIGAGSVEVLATTPDPLPPATTQYTDTLTVRTATLTAVASYVAAPATNTVTVDTTAGFRGAGKISINGHVVSYTGTTATTFTGCTWLASSSGFSAAVGTPVTQDLRALENISYTVRAFDTCSAGAKFSGDSNTVTAFPAGGCSPVCSMTVSPASIAPGATITISVTACAKAGNGTTDTIYVQACSACDTDAVALTETGPNTGVFTGTLGTLASPTCVAGGGSTVLTVKDGLADQVKIGGWADVPGTWEATCQDTGYTCGSQKIVEVPAPAPDPCAGIATPATPTITTVTPNSCTAAQPTITASWTGDAPSTTLFYRVFQCRNLDGAAACTLAKVSPATEPPATVQTTPLTYSYDEPANVKANAYEYWFQVEAVKTAAGCTDPTKWKTAISIKKVDSCP